MSARSPDTPLALHWPLLRLGFRPFYLCAALSGVVLMPLWWLVFHGHLQPTALPPVLWHGHEMLFGMLVAVIVGFLFTAGKVWTGLQTPQGGQLAGFVLLWLAARVASLSGPYPLFFTFDVMFLPLVATVFARLLLRAGNRRNLGIAAILALLGLANLIFHLSARQLLDMPAHWALHAALALIVVLETVIAGRVIPMFTRNAVPGIDTSVPPWRERLMLAATAVGFVLWLGGVAPQVTGMVLALAAVLHGWRLISWKPWRTRQRPILWVLHLAYAWIPVGLLLLAAAGFLPQAHSPALHALAVGASAGLILAMMTRTARGHTGRPLQASRTDVGSYGLILLAGAVRVFVPLLAPSWTMPALVVSGLLFAAAFLLYVLQYGGWLMSARVDGKDG